MTKWMHSDKWTFLRRDPVCLDEFVGQCCPTDLKVEESDGRFTP